ncbi:hypothetical protein B0H14DRAFT_3694416 [Mycena olivaceomarginata]|nr:hypothetical protein B0H14DRAFT_3694416 [Mycena olivaceomarginata]
MFHEEAEHNARSILEACGLDPDVITRTEMDELNPALQCLKCHDARGRLRMRWSQAGDHVHGRVLNSWKCLDLDEERLLEARERQDFETFSGRTPHHCCKICGDSRQMSFDKLKAHLGAEHGISDSITFEQHVAYHLDASVEERHPRPIWWKLSEQAVETSNRRRQWRGLRENIQKSGDPRLGSSAWATQSTERGSPGSLEFPSTYLFFECALGPAIVDRLAVGFVTRNTAVAKNLLEANDPYNGVQDRNERDILLKACRLILSLTVATPENINGINESIPR